LSEEHASYFRQAIAPEKGQSTSQDASGGNGANIPSIQVTAGEIATGNVNRGGITSESSWEAIPTGMPEQNNTSPNVRSQDRGDLDSPICGQSPGPEGDLFEANVISRMDDLIQDFRKEKTSQMETLYQILCVLQRADLEESVRQATLEKYTVYVDIIDTQQKGAE